MKNANMISLKVSGDPRSVLYCTSLLYKEQLYCQFPGVPEEHAAITLAAEGETVILSQCLLRLLSSAETDFMLW